MPTVKCHMSEVNDKTTQTCNYMYETPSQLRGFAVTLRRDMHNNLKDTISCKHDTVSVVLYVHEVPLDYEPSDMDNVMSFLI